MANTLTNLIPDLYAALDVVSREQVGLIPSVTLDASVARAAKGQSVRVPITPANAAGEDITPAMSLPSAADQTISNTEITISKSRTFPFSWNGEEQRGLDTGAGYLPIRAQQMLQAMRAAVNEIEADLAGLQSGFSRAYGTAGTTPFGTSGDFTDATMALKILKDNGAPLSDNKLVVNTAAGASWLGKQTNANVAFTGMFMEQGVLQKVGGMDIRESSFIETSVAGTGSSATTDNAGYAVGDTVITLASAGTGTILAGDVITFAGDTEKYVVASGDADVSGGGTITLVAPGLKKAIGTSATAITVVSAAARNMAFNRSAIVLATRMPERPSEGDLALDVMEITDPRSGLTFEVAMYPGHRMVRYEISIAYGVKLIKPEHTAILLG